MTNLRQDSILVKLVYDLPQRKWYFFFKFSKLRWNLQYKGNLGWGTRIRGQSSSFLTGSPRNRPSENCHFLELTRLRSNLGHIGNLGLETRIRDPTTLFFIGSRWKSCPTGKIPIFPEISKNEVLRMANFAAGVHFRGLPVKSVKPTSDPYSTPTNSPWTDFPWNPTNF